MRLETSDMLGICEDVLQKDGCYEAHIPTWPTWQPDPPGNLAGLTTWRALNCITARVRINLFLLLLKHLDRSLG